MVSKALLDAFETARYQVVEPEFLIQIGKRNLEVDQLLQNHGRRTWAFITPYNPGSKTISEEENQSRFSSLRKDVEGYISFEGSGGGQGPDWPLEKSLLILGISLSEAKKIGRLYGQDAIVFGRINQIAKIAVLI